MFFPPKSDRHAAFFHDTHNLVKEKTPPTDLLVGGNPIRQPVSGTRTQSGDRVAPRGCRGLVAAVKQPWNDPQRHHKTPCLQFGAIGREGSVWHRIRPRKGPRIPPVRERPPATALHIAVP